MKQKLLPYLIVLFAVLLFINGKSGGNKKLKLISSWEGRKVFCEIPYENTTLGKRRIHECNGGVFIVYDYNARLENLRAYFGSSFNKDEDEVGNFSLRINDHEFTSNHPKKLSVSDPNPNKEIRAYLSSLIGKYIDIDVLDSNKIIFANAKLKVPDICRFSLQVQKIGEKEKWKIYWKKDGDLPNSLKLTLNMMKGEESASQEFYLEDDGVFYLTDEMLEPLNLSDVFQIRFERIGLAITQSHDSDDMYCFEIPVSYVMGLDSIRAITLGEEVKSSIVINPHK